MTFFMKRCTWNNPLVLFILLFILMYVVFINHYMVLSKLLKPVYVDTSLFIFSFGGALFYLLVYVDDILLTRSNSKLLYRLITLVSLEFKLRDLGYMHYFLGIKVKPTSMRILLHQQKYVLDIIWRAGMSSCKSVDTPSSSSSKLVILSSVSYSDSTKYWQIVGALQYLTFTRPNICYVVNKVCQFMHAPTEDHQVAVKCILCYLQAMTSYPMVILVSSWFYWYWLGWQCWLS